MNCPKCHQPLESTTVKGVEIDQCGQCKGIWFDEGELSVLLQEDPQTLRPLRSGSEDEALNRKKGKCPRDGNDMIRVSSSKDRKLILDHCGSCRGIWLDGGELKRLVN